MLVAVDAAARRLDKLAGELQPALFPQPSDNGQGDVGREPSSRKQK